MDKEELKELEDKLNVSDIDQDLWLDYKQEIRKIMEENENYKKKLNDASVLLRKNACSKRETIDSKVVDEGVIIFLTNEQWETLTHLLENFYDRE